MTIHSVEDWFFSALKNKSASVGAAHKNLSKLTVVIPCYGRQDFLLRQCVYWHKSGATIVIVDGSRQALATSVQNTIRELARFTYLHAAVSMAERLSLAAEHIHTPYAILCGDDEFLLFTGLCGAIAKLEVELELVACIGQSLAFYPALDGATCTYGAGYPHWQYFVKDVAIDQRLARAMRGYTAATCYAVLRAPVWRKSWGQLRHWSSPYVAEMQQGLITYIMGKLATVDYVYWMRSAENKPVTNMSFNRGLSFSEWWGSSRFNSEHAQFIALLTDELMAVNALPRTQAEAVIRNAVQVFLDRANDTDTGRPSSLSLASLLKKLVPALVLQILKSWWFQRRDLPVQGALGELDALASSPTPTPFLLNQNLVTELRAMEALIADFHNARTIQN